MSDIFNKATSQRPEGFRQMDAPFLKLDLLFFINEIKSEKPWLQGDRNAITLLKNTLMRIVLIALRKDAEIKKHKATGNISVQVLEGNMIFTTDVQSIELTSGEIITLHEGVEHSVVAKEETVFLITIAINKN
jgi:quercetin dioxygenase-like cupin family protein